MSVALRPKTAERSDSSSANFAKMEAMRYKGDAIAIAGFAVFNQDRTIQLRAVEILGSMACNQESDMRTRRRAGSLMKEVAAEVRNPKDMEKVNKECRLVDQILKVETRVHSQDFDPGLMVEPGMQ